MSGVSEFAFTGAVPVVDGLAGILASATAGKVKKPASGNGIGRNLNVATSQATLSLSTVLAGDTVTINGVTFTAHTDTTTAANREFAISGTDTQDAAALAGLINDATYGVPGVTATPSVADVVIAVDDASKTRIVASETGGTITVAENAGRVRVLL